ncbi:MAG TPA: histidine kinase, partial [Candidatus Dormibacteraeota bacterium]|nr:histidine kinase [Candidatus Dormibacteraeota bacterium]
FLAYLAVTLSVLAAGLLVYVASTNPDFHSYLHTLGFAAESTPDRVALGIAGASHLPQSLGGIAVDYAFSLFNLALALQLLRLRPRNRTARLLAVGMIGTAALFNLQAYSVYEAMPAAGFETSFNLALQFIATLAYFFALLTFPDGDLIPRWPRAALTTLYAVAIAISVGGSYLLQDSHRASVIILFGLQAPVTAVLAQAYRLRRSQSEAQRQQARLLFWAMTPALILGLGVTVLGLGDVIFPQLQGRTLRELPVTTFRIFQPVFTIIPLALVAGIVRYGLWDVDRLISRTLVYGALAAFVSLLYIGVVVGVGTLIGSQGRNLGLSIAATGIAALAFNPLRDRFQRVANRLVYGRRATPYEVLSEFSDRLTEALGNEDLLLRMVKVLAEGTGARTAEVWIHLGGELRCNAAWPASNRPDEVLAFSSNSDDLPAFPGNRTAVAVRHRGEVLGALTVSKPEGEALSAVEEKLLRDLASQAGLVLRNVGLTAELVARLEDLQASRQRIVAAGNDARKRLERNIHDGAQQQLVALMIRLNLAENVAAKQAPQVAEMIAQLKVDTQDALETLRDLARGIYPPLLASEGLVAALEGHVRKVQVPMEVRALDVGRYDEETEAAVYFCCLEALQNVVKSARASRATVRLEATFGSLVFHVEDDGKGFDMKSVRRGAGLQNMIDRVEALGGTLELVSSPGLGTRISGTLPAAARTEVQRAATA